MTEMLRELVSLSRSMQALASAQALLSGVPEHMREVHEAYNAAQAEIAVLEADSESAGLARRQAEAAVGDAQDKLKKYQQQVARVRNQREYGAILSEIDLAKQELKRIEEAALSALERAEETARQLVARREGFTDLATQYQQELAKWEAEKPEVARRAAALAREVEEFKALLPRPIVAQLVRIFDRYHGDTLAVVHRVARPGTQAIWHCSSCNYQVRPQIALEIRAKGTIVQCEGCKRFLRPDDEA